MGGYSSTRWNGHARRCTVEESLHISVRDLRPHLATPCAASLMWQWSRDGKRVADISLQIGALSNLRDALAAWGCLSEAVRDSDVLRPNRSVTMRYSVRGDGTDKTIEEHTELVARPMRFTGLRWWLVCPSCRSLRTALYLPVWAGGTRWRCRRCYGLRYLAQRLDPTARMELRMRRVSSRLHSGHWEHWFDFPPAKPKWMRLPTYAWHVEEWERASAARDAFCFAGMTAFLARCERHGTRPRR
jgi:hypothetical protein